MPGFKLMLQDDNGEYPYSGRALIFEGSMLVYDHQRDIAQWVPVRGMSATLTMPVLRAAHDLNNMVPSPLSELPVAQLPSIEVMKCIPAGAESDMNRLICWLGGWVGQNRDSGTLKEFHSHYENRSHLGGRARSRSGRRGGEKPGPIMGRHAKHNAHWGGRKLGRGGQPVRRGRPVRRCCRRSSNTHSHGWRMSWTVQGQSNHSHNREERMEMM